MKTALNLQAFEFNRLPDPYEIRGNLPRPSPHKTLVPVDLLLLPHGRNAAGDGSKEGFSGSHPAASEPTIRLCAICSSPLPSSCSSALKAAGAADGHSDSSPISLGCCRSCQSQIIAPLRISLRDGGYASGGGMLNSSVDDLSSVMGLFPEMIRDRLLLSS